MTAKTLRDATKECSNNASCNMFYDDVGSGKKFFACDKTSSIKETADGTILYQNHGNEMTRHS